MTDATAKIRVPVVKGAAYFLGHVPGLVRYGSKPAREIERTPDYLDRVLGGLQSFPQAVSYRPNQIFIGNMDPDELKTDPRALV